MPQSSASILEALGETQNLCGVKFFRVHQRSAIPFRHGRGTRLRSGAHARSSHYHPGGSTCRVLVEASVRAGPAYLIGMVPAGTAGRNYASVRLLLTLTFGFLTPFYFIRAGSFVSIPALFAAPSAFIFISLSKSVLRLVAFIRYEALRLA
jgi:hypothetical protein